MTESQHFSTRFHRVHEQIQQSMRERGIPSLAIAVSQGDTILWEEGVGWADREQHILATPHTLYSLGSLSKPITATALMRLCERQQIDLETPINNYLGINTLQAWCGKSEDATVRRVANHTAGLPLHYQFFYDDEPERPPPIDITLQRYGQLVTQPGERFLYSNMGYGLFSHIIASLSHTSFADFLRDEIFLPLGMQHATATIEPNEETLLQRARRYGTPSCL
jgi:CubicO group peptidase (beta-lactamase class C family)